MLRRLDLVVTYFIGGIIVFVAGIFYAIFGDDNTVDELLEKAQWHFKKKE